MDSQVVTVDQFAVAMASIQEAITSLDSSKDTQMPPPPPLGWTALYGIEEGIARGLWPDSSPLDSKGKKPAIGIEIRDINAINAARRGPLDIIRELVYTTRATQRPPAHCPQPRAPTCTETDATVSQLRMPLSRAFQKLVEGGLLTALAPRPPPQLMPPHFRLDLHCAYHQGPGHTLATALL
ncbi:hypothetical protein CK203_056261 [Vitis vinifera]|uniref:Uncharacterized protein n=1 Tax=Vitis vinifera TaxID=29760 RepID=A0A438GJL5_VITVI|nr:hypothetical protein CK203_056261 [Vitis vinifera]